MNFNEFQRELRNRNIDGHLAVMLTTMYERMLDNAKQLNTCAQLLVSLTQTVQQFANLHEATQGRLKELLKRDQGVTVESTHLTDPEDYNR